MKILYPCLNQLLHLSLDQLYILKGIKTRGWKNNFIILTANPLLLEMSVDLPRQIDRPGFVWAIMANLPSNQFITRKHLLVS